VSARQQQSQWKRQLWLTVGGLVVAMLAAAVFTLGSLKIPLHPEQDNAFLIFFALSTFIAAALLVFTLILARNLLRLWAERRSHQMGSRFKAKMVAGAMGVSLLPVVFLFFFSYSLVNRTLALWFPRPLEIANEQSQILVTNFRKAELTRLNNFAAEAAAHPAHEDNLLALSRAVDATWVVDARGNVTGGVDFTNTHTPNPPASHQAAGAAPMPVVPTSITPKMIRTIQSGAEVWQAGDQLYVAGHAPFEGGALYAARHLPADFLDSYDQIEAQMEIYAQQKRHMHAYKREIILALLLITLLLLFTTTWVALFLSKQVTVPIQALAEATREISRGNFDHHIDVQAQDELGTLVRSFNRMTEQLGEGRRQINEFTQSLEQAVEERERRRKLMEAILENIPTGVISLDSSGNIARVNSALAAILGDHARGSRTLSELLGDEAARAVLHLMRRSLRMGAASREIEVATGGRLVRAAVTVTSLGPRRSNPGFIIVIDDLTDLLRAQKAAAWQEVAQRIAHEIKNPLTPIQLSAERLLRHLDRASAANPDATRTDFEKLAAECAALIGREVQTLESLVDAFSQFARFPSARLAATDLNAIVSSALDLFRGRLEGISVRATFASSLPSVKADPELLRRVVANLIDNAAEAMEGSAIRELTVATRAESDDDAVVIEISDSGHGISPQDKERLFLPHFSTKDRGTGLGLAIASRIVAEHNGSIRVEDNVPTGSKFLIRFPAVEVAATQQAGTPAA
jgi:two-component system, NtrC family, nitrogen regulation sensor histidine kinase NtrY